MSNRKKLKPRKFSKTKGSWRAEKNTDTFIAGTTLTLVTFNVWFETYHIQERYEALLRILRDCDADLIGLQEVTPSFLKIILAEEWVKDNFYVSDHKGKTVDPYGVILLSRFPIQTLTLYDLPTYMYRKLLVADLNINGQNIKVATVHLESHKISSPFRAKQLSVIFPILSEGEHSVLMGDFNFCSSWDEENANIDTAYQDMWSVLKGDEPGYTEDTDINIMRLEVEGKEKQVRFDRILVCSSASGWLPELIQLIGTESTADNHPNIFPSDHFGLVGKLSWKGS